LFKSTTRALFILMLACIIFANLIKPGTHLKGTDYVVKIMADTAIDNSTNITVSRPTGNYTNATALVTEGPRQIITGRPAMGQVAPQDQPGLNTPNAIPGGNVISIPNINITREQAVKAEQEANVMIKDYYEKVKQEEEQKARQQAAALAAAAQVNQTINNASQAEGSLEGNATASAIETEDDTDLEAEEEDGAEEDEENDNENGGNEEEEGDSE
jgi:hypothetical protein